MLSSTAKEENYSQLLDALKNKLHEDMQFYLAQCICTTVSPGKLISQFKSSPKSTPTKRIQWELSYHLQHVMCHCMEMPC